VFHSAVDQINATTRIGYCSCEYIEAIYIDASIRPVMRHGTKACTLASFANREETNVRGARRQSIDSRSMLERSRRDSGEDSLHPRSLESCLSISPFCWKTTKPPPCFSSPFLFRHFTELAPFPVSRAATSSKLALAFDSGNNERGRVRAMQRYLSPGSLAFSGICHSIVRVIKSRIANARYAGGPQSERLIRERNSELVRGYRQNPWRDRLRFRALASEPLCSREFKPESRSCHLDRAVYPDVRPSGSERSSVQTVSPSVRLVHSMPIQPCDPPRNPSPSSGDLNSV